MKIMMVSMNSIHFRRWSDQLRESGHEVFWFDIKDQGYAPSMSWMTQITGWKKGFLKKRGRTFLKNRLPKLYNALVHKYDTSVEHAFAKALQEIQPDLVHSFALYVSCTPILNIMNAHPNVSWVYSSWGSDLFYYRNEPSYLIDIKEVLPRLNYMFADCKRDQHIADELGFTGKHLGVIPGGGGFDLSLFEKYKTPYKKRNIIAVKGNQNRSGRAVPVLKALELLHEDLQDYKIIVFGAENLEVFEFQKNTELDIQVLGLMEYDRIIQLLCTSLIYIGNSNSDGMPNTLLEAICAGAFPVQSNPGNATAEIIKHGENGLLIDDCENIEQIKDVITFFLQSDSLGKNGIAFNDVHIVPQLSRTTVQDKVLETYNSIKEK
ncbi:MAG: glycosyltransferase family 4 protein [Nonlabens sp.]|uniref:glycosyltransferase family 4 protein n=1 Tax=Nonlabens sp. TaxID=1888209 RepID=UPI003EF4E4F4